MPLRPHQERVHQYNHLYESFKCHTLSDQPLDLFLHIQQLHWTAQTAKTVLLLCLNFCLNFFKGFLQTAIFQLSFSKPLFEFFLSSLFILDHAVIVELYGGDQIDNKKCPYVYYTYEKWIVNIRACHVTNLEHYVSPTV